jgi:hypothetical protein
MLAAAATALTMAFPFQPVVAAPRDPDLAVERVRERAERLHTVGGAPQPFSSPSTRKTST